MDRRKFLGTSTIAGIPIVAQSSEKGSFGPPASLTGGKLATPKDGLLTIPIDDAFIPANLKTVTRSISELFTRVSVDSAFANALATNPEKILDDYGLANVLPPGDPLLEALRISAEADLRIFLEKADYASFMAQLKSKGLLKRISRTQLKNYYVEQLTKDQLHFDRYLKTLITNQSARIKDAQTKPYRVNKIISLVEEGTGRKVFDGAEVNDVSDYPQAVAAAVTLVYIAVGAVTYVIAATQVLVGLNVAAYVTAATRVAIKVSSTLPNRMQDGQLNIMDAGTQTLRNLQTMSIAAEIAGRTDVAVEAIKRAIDEEVVAVIAAAEKVGLIALPRSTRNAIISEIKKLTREALSIG